ncbi:hypothetical protein NEOLI_003790, partial [Neolecta irregularis DAH-3]
LKLRLFVKSILIFRLSYSQNFSIEFFLHRQFILQMRFLGLFLALLLLGVAFEIQFASKFDLIYDGSFYNWKNPQDFLIAFENRNPEARISDCLSECLNAQFTCAMVTFFYEFSDLCHCHLSKTRALENKPINPGEDLSSYPNLKAMIFVRKDLLPTPPALEPLLSWRPLLEWSNIIIPKYHLQPRRRKTTEYLTLLHKLLFIAKPPSTYPPYDRLLLTTLELMNGRSLSSLSVDVLLNTTISHIFRHHSSVSSSDYRSSTGLFINRYKDEDDGLPMKTIIYKPMEISTSARKSWIFFECERNSFVPEPQTFWQMVNSAFAMTEPSSVYTDEIRYHSFGVKLTDEEHKKITRMARENIEEEYENIIDLKYVDSPGVNGYGSEPSINAVLSIINHVLSLSFGRENVNKTIHVTDYGIHTTSGVTFKDGIDHLGQSFRVFLKDYIIALVMLNHQEVFRGLVRQTTRIARNNAFSDVDVIG